MIGRAKASARRKRCDVCCLISAGLEPVQIGGKRHTLGRTSTAQADPAETVSGFRPTDHAAEPPPKKKKAVHTAFLLYRLTIRQRFRHVYLHYW
jgi:hypothetical protein